MARPCAICSDKKKIELAAEMLASGATDQAVADAIGGISRMAVCRHRENHIIKPAQDRMAIIGKGATRRTERQQLAQAAAVDTPSPQEFVDALMGLKAQAEKLGNIEARLERMAALAEVNESSNGVAQLSAQQLRGVEVGAKLAGAGGYAPARASTDAGGSVFSINFVFQNAPAETIIVRAPQTTIEADPFEGDGF